MTIDNAGAAVVVVVVVAGGIADPVTVFDAGL
jgi:hypothetical protein